VPDHDEPHAAERDRLRREALRYEALLTADGAIIWVVDADLRPTGTSESWEAYTGQTVGHDTGLSWLDSIHRDDHPRVRSAAAEASQSGRPLALELRIRRADGAWRRHLIRAIPVREHGTIVEWIGTATDVEDDRRLADEQRDLRGRLLALTDGAEILLSTHSTAAARESVLDLAQRVLPGDACAIWWHDATGSEWRVVAARGLGDRFIGSPLQGGMIPFADPLAVMDVNAFSMLESRRDAYAAEGIRSLFAVPLPIGGTRVGTLVIYYRSPHEATDTERRVGVALGQMAAAALWNAETYEALTRANQAKDDFLAILSHELRTPLNAIMGWSHMLRDGLPPDLTTHAIEVISRNARAQKQLIEDLLDVARIASGRLDLSPRPVDLVEIGRVAVDSALPAARAADITLAFEAPEYSLVVDGDVDRLQQVAANLLSNALKFTDRGGRVSVRVDGEAGVRLLVSDTGAGIEPDFLPYVFERFTQHDTSLSRPFPGLGLGLWVVRQIVEAHGGTVHAESEGRGCGTTIVVFLPAAL
jgi:PAS domain S-box-containing protein